MKAAEALGAIGRAVDLHDLTVFSVGSKSAALQVSLRLPGPVFVSARIEILDCIDLPLLIEGIGRGLREIERERNA